MRERHLLLHSHQVIPPAGLFILGDGPFHLG